MHGIFFSCCLNVIIFFPSPKTRLIFGFLGALGTLMHSSKRRRFFLYTPGLLIGVDDDDVVVAVATLVVVATATPVVAVAIVVVVDGVVVAIVVVVDGVDETTTAGVSHEHTIWLQQNCSGLERTADKGKLNIAFIPQMHCGWLQQ